MYKVSGLEKSRNWKKVGKFQGKSGNLILDEIIQGQIREFCFGTP